MEKAGFNELFDSKELSWSEKGIELIAKSGLYFNLQTLIQTISIHSSAFQINVSSLQYVECTRFSEFSKEALVKKSWDLRAYDSLHYPVLGS